MVTALAISAIVVGVIAVIGNIAALSLSSIDTPRKVAALIGLPINLWFIIAGIIVL